MLEVKDFVKRYKYIILFCIGIIILFLRSAYNFKNPVMYAEDGVWSSYIYKNGFRWTAFSARSDYYVLILAGLLKLADIFDWILFDGNLSYLPYIICIISYVCITLVALLPSITLGKRVSWLGKLFLYLGILLLPMGTTTTEIIGRILQLHFYMWIIVFCLLVYRYDNKENRKLLIVGCDAIILAAVATIPSVLLLILGYGLIEVYMFIKRNFYSKNIGKKTKRFSLKNIKKTFAIETKKYFNWHLLFFMLATFALGLSIMLKMNGEVVNSPDPGNAANIIEFFVRSLSFVLIWPFYTNLNNVSGVVVLILTVLLYIGGFISIKKENRIFYILCILSCLSITFITFSSRFYLTSHLYAFTIQTVPDRYYILMNMTSLFPLAIFVSDAIKEKTKIKKYFAVAFILYILIINVLNYKDIFQYDDNKMVWLTNISFGERLKYSYNSNNLDETGCFYKVEIDPSWEMEVPIERMELSVKNN